MKKNLWKQALGLIVGAAVSAAIWILLKPRKEFTVDVDEQIEELNSFKLHKLRNVPKPKNDENIIPLVMPKKTKKSTAKKKEEKPVQVMLPKVEEQKALPRVEKKKALPKVEEKKALPKEASKKEEAMITNINTATKKALVDLPLIGDSKADAIIAYRAEHGDFAKVDDLVNVSGISDKLLAKIKDLLTI